MLRHASALRRFSRSAFRTLHSLRSSVFYSIFSQSTLPRRYTYGSSTSNADRVDRETDSEHTVGSIVGLCRAYIGLRERKKASTRGNCSLGNPSLLLHDLIDRIISMR
jgi:hypothetical protein